MFKTLLTTLIVLCSLFVTATTASAFSGKPGKACFLGMCWDNDPAWGYGYVADADTGTVINETEVAEIDTTGFVGFITAAATETELPSTDLASTEFGNCLLNDAPIDLESLVDCRSDACLGRKFYYGL